MKLSQEEIFYIKEFSAATGIMPRDCIIDGDTIAFVVKEDVMGRAIGKKGGNIKRLSSKLRKKVEVLSFTEGAGEFIKKAFPQKEFIEVKKEQGTLNLRLDSTSKREILSNRRKFNRIKKIAERNYNIQEIKLR